MLLDTNINFKGGRNKQCAAAMNNIILSELFTITAILYRAHASVMYIGRLT